MNAPSTTDTNQTTAPPPLWRVAAAFMHILHALFGAPEDVAARHTLRFEAHKLMASWLRAGEAMMRRLLLIEAAAHAKPNTRPLLRAPRKRTRKLMHFFPETPEQWRVSFRCFTTTLRQPRIKSGGDAVCGAADPVSVSLSLSKAKAPRPFVFREHRPPPRPSRARAKRSKRARHKPILRQDREWLTHQAPLRFRSAWPLAERYEALLRVFRNPSAYAARLARRLHATPHRARELLRTPPEIAPCIDEIFERADAAKTCVFTFNSS